MDLGFEGSVAVVLWEVDCWVFFLLFVFDELVALVLWESDVVWWESDVGFAVLLFVVVTVGRCTARGESPESSSIMVALSARSGMLSPSESTSTGRTAAVLLLSMGISASVSGVSRTFEAGS